MCLEGATAAAALRAHRRFPLLSSRQRALLLPRHAPAPAACVNVNTTTTTSSLCHHLSSVIHLPAARWLSADHHFQRHLSGSLRTRALVAPPPPPPLPHTPSLCFLYDFGHHHRRRLRRLFFPFFDPRVTVPHTTNGSGPRRRRLALHRRRYSKDCFPGNVPTVSRLLFDRCVLVPPRRRRHRHPDLFICWSQPTDGTARIVDAFVPAPFCVVYPGCTLKRPTDRLRGAFDATPMLSPFHAPPRRRFQAHPISLCPATGALCLPARLRAQRRGDATQVSSDDATSTRRQPTSQSADRQSVSLSVSQRFPVFR
jgi:hypothetical protein